MVNLLRMYINSTTTDTEATFLTQYRSYTNSNRFTTYLENLDIWLHMETL